MALNPEEFQQKRLARQQQRQAAQRKLRVRLALIGVAVAVVAVIALLLVRKGGASNTPATTPPQNITTITVAAVGDVNITKRVVDSGSSRQDYSEIFKDVSHLLSNPELTLMNLEGVASGPPYGESRSAPQEFLDALKLAGVDGVQVANSYTIHDGIANFASTIAALNETGLLSLGAYPFSDEAHPYTVVEVQGIRIAIVAFTKGALGMEMLSKGNYGANTLYTDYTTFQKIDTDRINKILAAIRKDKPDLTIAMVHWGSEYNDTISKTQDKIKDLLLKGGVNAVIGTHPHYVQEMSLNDKGQFVAYSLGDFLGDVPRSGTEYSLILNLTVEKNNDTGVTKITGFDYTPTFIIHEEDQPLQVVRLKEAITAYESGQLGRVNQTTYEAMKYALTRVDARVAGK